MNASMCCARSTSRCPRRRCLRSKRDLLKPEVIWNIEEGLKLTVEQLERAEAQRVAMTARTLEFFDKYDLLLCARHDRTALPGREPLRRRMRRQEVRQLRRMARHRLRDHAGVLSRAVAAVRLYRLGPAGRAAGGGAAARRGAVAGGSQGPGGYSRRARHDTDRSKGAEVSAIVRARSRIRPSVLRFVIEEPGIARPRFPPLCSGELIRDKGIVDRPLETDHDRSSHQICRRSF